MKLLSQFVVVMVVVLAGRGVGVDDRSGPGGSGGGRASGAGGGSSNSTLSPASFACDIGSGIARNCIEYSYNAIDPQTLNMLRTACAGSLVSSCSSSGSLGACRMTVSSSGVIGTSTVRYYAPGTMESTYRSACTTACSAGAGTTGCTWLN